MRDNSFITVKLKPSDYTRTAVPGVFQPKSNSVNLAKRIRHEMYQCYTRERGTLKKIIPVNLLTFKTKNKRGSVSKGFLYYKNKLLVKYGLSFSPPEYEEMHLYFKMKGKKRKR